MNRKQRLTKASVQRRNPGKTVIVERPKEKGPPRVAGNGSGGKIIKN